MKKIFITSLLSLGIAASGHSQAPTQADFNRAVMQAYADMLRENYKDYETLFRRANTYYNDGNYLKALDDLDSAVKYAPETDTETLYAIYALRTECYYQLKRYSQALPEANEALKFDPTSSPMLELRAKIEYDLGLYSEAKADYNKLLRINSRSQEAYFGLALVAAKENNIGLASDYMQKAVDLMPGKSSTYVRSAEVRVQIGDYNAAVDDLLLAIATDADDPDALPALVQLANGNYSAVMSGLSGAIRQAPRQPLFYYLRGSIAAAHYHYPAAIDDFKYILSEGLYDYSGIYCALAECYYALGHYQTALDNSDAAIASSDGTDDVCHYYTVRAMIQRAMGNEDKALNSIDRALDFMPDDIDATVEKALILAKKETAKESSALLGEVVMSQPYDPMNYMTRAWVLNDFLNQPKAAKGLYARVIDLELDHPERVTSLLGFAQLFDGKTAPAIAWMDAILAEPDYDGRNHYLGACFYAWAGRTDKALECTEAALKAGYANYHDWMNNDDSRINVGPLRHSEAFKSLMQKYKSIFAI